ncbi:hypothetical protein [Microbacterium hydrocarbonoxydans]|uniref:hypothetical protein n=1 Tax=Microbacterium hydrocarbonoxydans TaxID=273678 RepID=UPI003D95692C
MMSILSKAGGAVRFRTTHFFALTTVSIALGFLGMVGNQAVQPLLDFGTGEQPPVSQPPADQPLDDGEPSEPTPDVEIGEPESALGKAIWAELGPADFFAGPKAEHAPDEIHPESGRVQEPLRGDMVLIAWNSDLKEGDTVTLKAGGETYWLAVDESNVLKGGTYLQILLEKDQPKNDPNTGEAPQTEFTGSTLLAALEAAGYGWKAPYPAEGDDVERGLRDWGVTLSGTTAGKVTLVVGGSEFVLDRLGETYFLG